MSDLIAQTVYYAAPGAASTDRTLHLVAGERARALGIRTVLVATTSGETGARAAELGGVGCRRGDPLGRVSGALRFHL